MQKTFECKKRSNKWHIKTLRYVINLNQIPNNLKHAKKIKLKSADNFRNNFFSYRRDFGVHTNQETTTNLNAWKWKKVSQKSTKKLQTGTFRKYLDKFRKHDNKIN